MSNRLTDLELSDLEQLARVHRVATATAVERLIDEVRELRAEIARGNVTTCTRPDLVLPED